MHRGQGLFLSVSVDEMKITGRKQNLYATWRLRSWLILENLHHFLSICTWDVLEVNSNRTRKILRNTKKFESRVSAEAPEKIQGVNPHAKTVVWSQDMEGHAKKCEEINCKLAKKLSNCTKVSTCLDGPSLQKEEELETVGELSKVCSQIVLTCLYLDRIW